MFRNRNKIYFCLGGTLLYLPIIDRSSGCVDRGAVKVDYMTFILKKRLFVLCLFVSFTFVLLSVFLSESLSIHHCFMDFFLIPNICLCRMTGVVVVQAGNVGGHKLSIQGKGLLLSLSEPAFFRVISNLYDGRTRNKKKVSKFQIGFAFRFFEYRQKTRSLIDQLRFFLFFY